MEIKYSIICPYCGEEFLGQKPYLSAKKAREFFAFQCCNCAHSFNLMDEKEIVSLSGWTVRFISILVVYIWFICAKIAGFYNLGYVEYIFWLGIPIILVVPIYTTPKLAQLYHNKLYVQYANEREKVKAKVRIVKFSTVALLFCGAIVITIF